MSYMDNVVEEIRSSHRERDERLAAIASETSQLLRIFSTEHTEMSNTLKISAQALRDSLERFRHDLDTSEKKRLSTSHAEIRERREDTREMLDKFKDEFDKNERERYNQTLSEMHARKAELLNTLKKFQNELGKSETARRRDSVSDIKTRRSDIQIMRDNLDATLLKFKTELMKHESDRIVSSQNSRTELQKNIGELKESTRDILEHAQEYLGEVKKEHQDASRCWQSLVGALTDKGTHAPEAHSGKGHTIKKEKTFAAYEESADETAEELDEKSATKYGSEEHSNAEHTKAEQPKAEQPKHSPKAKKKKKEPAFSGKF
ncbi:MAG: hypothetical protein AB9903_26645 [Vulcanimicrobiota bacterium]